MSVLPIILPNAENLLSQFLRRDAAVLATELGDRTYTELPKVKTWPACRITRVGGETDLDLMFDYPLLQVEVWGGGKTVAERIAQTIRASLAARLPFRNDDGCLMVVTRFGGLRYLPDGDEDPARPRYLFDLRVTTRS